MAIDFYDTSAILAQGSIPDYSYISHFVISELEEIKNSSYKDESIKQKARAATRALIANTTIQTHNVDLRKVERIRKKYNFLPDNMDGRIIAEAILLQKEKKIPVNFWTADFNMKLFCESCGFIVYFVGEKEKKNELYTGWGKYYLNDEELASLYSNPQMNILDAKINEYCLIHQNNEELKDILRWSGEKYTKLNYKAFKSVQGEKIAPLNLHQKLYFDLLENPNIPIKLALGTYGSGKSMLMITYALRLIRDGVYDKLYYIRNTVGAKNAAQVGYLKGDVREKLRGYLAAIGDQLPGGEMELEQLMDEGVIEPILLSEIRGRSFSRSLLLVDEAENLTKNLIQLIIGRVGKDSQLWVAADLRQVDARVFEIDNGIRAMIEALAGEKLFGMVKLMKSERSEVARLSDKLDYI